MCGKGHAVRTLLHAMQATLIAKCLKAGRPAGLGPAEFLIAARQPPRINVACARDDGGGGELRADIHPHHLWPVRRASACSNLSTPPVQSHGAASRSQRARALRREVRRGRSGESVARQVRRADQGRFVRPRGRRGHPRAASADRRRRHHATGRVDAGRRGRRRWWPPSCSSSLKSRSSYG